MLQRGVLGCAQPDKLGVLAGRPVLVANMTGFHVASTAGSPALYVPSVSVYVHPPAEDRLISKGLLEHGSWSHRNNEKTRRTVVGLMLQLLTQSTPAAIFMDIGANIGTFSLPLLAAGYSGLLVEASPRNAWRLRASICALGPIAHSHAVVVAPVALSSTSNGTACMKLAKSQNMGTMSVTVNESGYCDGDEVPTAQLDDIVFGGTDATLCSSPVVALKIDVEQHEQEVFLGADRVLRHCKPQHIFIEGGPGTPAVKLLMEKYKYTIVQTFERGRDTHLALGSGRPFRGAG